MPAKPGRPAGGAASGKTQMTSGDAARIQAAQAKAGGDTGKSSFPARAQAAAAKNAAGGPTPKAGKGSKAT